MSADGRLCLAYYCSGHGYGHATRVSAFARYLLTTNPKDQPLIYIVSSAPERVFADSIICGARYRFAEIDPVIVQPLAYRVDRRRSVEVLKKFLRHKEALLAREREWLLEIKAHSVLSDAAFLGCLAAKEVGIPSILITNFSFDSVYSYLTTQLLDVAPSSHHTDALPSLLDILPDDPIPHSELSPLVEQIHAGYRCADLLVRLPGHIPIPSFFVQPSLPSSDWINVETRRMLPEVVDSLTGPMTKMELHPSLPFVQTPQRKTKLERSVVQAPLLVRPPSSALSVYTLEGRSKLLSSIGVPVDRHDPRTTKVLVVSFGGQVFRKPTGSRSPISRKPSQENLPGPHASKKPYYPESLSNTPKRPHALKARNTNGLGLDIDTSQIFQTRILAPANFDLHIPETPPRKKLFSDDDSSPVTAKRLATPCHLWIPGAPPASKPLPTPALQSPTIVVPTLNTIPPTPEASHFSPEDLDPDGPRLLPDSSWIAIVCGVSKEQWTSESGDKDSELPEGFYVAPRDVYMPDLTAVGDVLLGKLGYGTVSECVDACTPFVYVSRPLFIEEHGLRLLLDQEGVGVELSREMYEAGDWSSAVTEALMNGQDMKANKRADMAKGIGADRSEREGKMLAGTVTEWVRAWWNEEDGCLRN
ncbi:hypothetical protein B0H34DRAFT_729986 [Crassisporium funariophilum]|nr:hypothetical protein B0H34DRAFT_729986 [Crassisporium funariophilum]